MVSIALEFEAKQLRATYPGELFRFRLRNQLATGITLAIEPVRHALVGVVEFSEIGHPFWVQIPLSESCFSFGTDWAIEPIIGSQTYPNNVTLEDRRRILFMHEGKAFLRFDRPQNPSDFEATYACISGDEHLQDSPDVQAAPFAEWRIWLSSEDRLRLGAKPFLEFGG